MKRRSYSHTESISIDSVKQFWSDKFSNPWLLCILKHPGVMKTIPGLTLLPSSVRAKTSTKITFSAYNFYIIIFFGSIQRLQISKIPKSRCRHFNDVWCGPCTCESNTMPKYLLYLLCIFRTVTKKQTMFVFRYIKLLKHRSNLGERFNVSPNRYNCF